MLLLTVVGVGRRFDLARLLLPLLVAVHIVDSPIRLPRDGMLKVRGRGSLAGRILAAAV